MLSGRFSSHHTAEGRPARTRIPRTRWFERCDPLLRITVAFASLPALASAKANINIRNAGAARKESRNKF
jgi:hypothetical protein